MLNKFALSPYTRNLEIWSEDDVLETLYLIWTQLFGHSQQTELRQVKFSKGPHSVAVHNVLINTKITYSFLHCLS